MQDVERSISYLFTLTHRHLLAYHSGGTVQDSHLIPIMLVIERMKQSINLILFYSDISNPSRKKLYYTNKIM